MSFSDYLPGGFEGLLSGVGEFSKEALNIQAQGFLNEQRQKNGLETAQPRAEDQLPTRVNSDGGNLTAATAAIIDSRWLKIGGGVLALLLIAALLWRALK